MKVSDRPILDNRLDKNTIRNRCEHADRPILEAGYLLFVFTLR